MINWQDYEGRTALHLAVADGNAAVVKNLVNIKLFYSYSLHKFFQHTGQKCTCFLSFSILVKSVCALGLFIAILGRYVRLLSKRMKFSAGHNEVCGFCLVDRLLLLVSQYCTKCLLA